jgi:hypothetical protein
MGALALPHGCATCSDGRSGSHPCRHGVLTLKFGLDRLIVSDRVTPWRGGACCLPARFSEFSRSIHSLARFKAPDLSADQAEEGMYTIIMDMLLLTEYHMNHYPAEYVNILCIYSYVRSHDDTYYYHMDFSPRIRTVLVYDLDLIPTIFEIFKFNEVEVRSGGVEIPGTLLTSSSNR